MIYKLIRNGADYDLISNGAEVLDNEIKELLEKYDLSKFKTFVKDHKLYIELNDIAELGKSLNRQIIYIPKKFIWEYRKYEYDKETLMIYDQYIE